MARLLCHLLLQYAALAHGLYVGPPSTRWLSPPLFGRSSVRMGVSDRMANYGLLYEGWGAEGMRVLNKTATLQEVSESFGTTRYDTVLIVAARAKENAYQNAEVNCYLPRMLPPHDSNTLQP